MKATSTRWSILHPEVVLRSDGSEARPSANHVIRGAAEAAGRAMTYAGLSPFVQPVFPAIGRKPAYQAGFVF